ncbi:L-cysteine desulfhydrase [Sesamum angolense]|uniref:L-cysteine desulfhydrase n=1 Tax=Sesamum angolense TaxID=2727404 RepID=A0AAE1X8M5_9LAMI|nr:L-cysteine desulfhydrase [Sesamum angolense]
MDPPAGPEDPRAATNGDNSHIPKKPKLSFITQSQILEEFAHHQPGIARINNGSFGSCPASIIAAQKSWQLRFLRQPDDFFFNHLQRQIIHSRSIIKDLINADHVDEAVKKSIEAYVTRAGGSVIVVHLPFPVNSDEEIIAEFRKGLARGRANGKKVRLAIIDHITSMPCVVIPARELVKICREEGVERVFVDAAHAIGNVHIDVKEIGADFYVSNLHKWFFCPPSVAFLYCRKSPLSHDLHHPVVSHEYGNGLAIESAWIGTRDYSSQLVIPEVFEFTNRFEGGLEGIRKRNHDKVVEMGQMLAKAWGTNLGSPPEMCPSMAMIGLPSRLGILSDDDALNLRSHLRDHFGVEVPIYYQMPRDGHIGATDGDGCVTGYARISHQVYNTLDDYVRLRDAITQLVHDGVTCKMLQ